MRVRTDRSPRPSILLALVLGLLAPAARAGAPLHTFDGKHSIDKIDLTVVYLVPKDRTPLPDWRARVDYYTKRIEAFHRRELDGQSELRVHVRPEPFLSPKTTEEYRGGDANKTFFLSVNGAREALGWPGERTGFPILLVLSDINWRELDDFSRTRVIDGVLTHEGNIGGNGRHFPGADSGGARAAYLAREGMALGLVSADGWRVPYSGSDCVVYHEGVGHPIGLPHPEPGDGSVMSQGQYRYWINESWIETSQKKALGWEPPADAPDKSKTPDLFTAFRALQAPLVPKVGATIDLDLKWPPEAKVRDLTVQVQTALTGPWITIPTPVTDAEKAPSRVLLGSFDRPTPVSYRVRATLQDGQEAEVRGYFQVK